MWRGTLLVAVCVVAAAGVMPPQVLVDVKDGELQLDMVKEVFFEMLGRARDVLVVGGYGTGVGLSTLFNAASLAGKRDTGLDSGFPITPPTRTRRAAIWMYKPGTSVDGKTVILLSCEGCYQHHNKSFSEASMLFYFMQQACHHLVYHSAAPTQARVNRFELLLRHALQMQLSRSPEVSDQVVPAPVKTPMTWAYDAVGASSDKQPEALARRLLDDKTLPPLRWQRVPSPVDDERLALLRNMREARLSDLTPSYLDAAASLVNNAASAARKWDIPAGALYSYYELLVSLVQGSDPLEVAVDDLRIIRTSMEDRKMFALGLYRDVLTKVALGDARWIKRVVAIDSKAVPLLRALKGRPAGSGAAGKDYEAVLELLKERATQVKILESSAPATDAEYTQSEGKAWEFALRFFSSGFSDSKDFFDVRQELRIAMSEIKEDLRAQHSKAVESYLTELAKAVKQAVTTFYETSDLPVLGCSPEVELTVAAELGNAAAAAFASSRKESWWQQKTVDSYIKQTTDAISSMSQQRLKESSALLTKKADAAVKEALKDFRERCRVPESAPVKTEELLLACKTARTSAKEYLEKIGLSLAGGRCKGTPWVLQSKEFVNASKSLRQSCDDTERQSFAENERRVEQLCLEMASGLGKAGVANLRKAENHEEFDEDKVRAVAASELKQIKGTLHASWGGFPGEGYASCVRHLESQLQEALDATILQIETTLFGHDECQAWRAAFSEDMNASFREKCQLCRYTSFFTEHFLASEAIKSAPTAVGGKPISPSFRDAIVRRAVKKDLRENWKLREPDRVMWTYAVSAVLGVPLLVYAASLIMSATSSS